MAGLPDIKLSPSGLHTNTSALEAPPGGLEEAEDIIIRRPGMAEPRPGFSHNANVWSVTFGDDIRSLHSFGGKRLATYVNGTSPGAEWDDGQDVTDELGSQLGFDRFVDSVPMRGNLYITARDSIRKITSGGHATAYRAGPPPTTYLRGMSFVSGLNTGITTGKTIAVKIVTLREDVNGVQVRSAPSNRSQGTSAADRDIQLLVSLHQTAAVGFQEGDQLEIYRTIEADGTPEEEYFLSRRYTLTAADLTAGGVTITDTTPEGDLSLALYTNDNVEGSEATHLQPFQAGCVCEFNGSLWAGNLSYAAQIIIAFTYRVPASDGEVGRHEFSGVFTNGSDEISSVVPASGTMAQFKVGQIIGNSGAFVDEWSSATTAYVRITAINGTTFTVSQTWTGLGSASLTRYAYDSVKIDSQYFPVPQLVQAIRTSVQDGAGTGDASASVTADSLRLNTVLGSGDRVEVALSHYDPIEDFTIQATNGDQYDPPLPEPSATAMTVEPDTIPNGVAWSDAREPEHWKVSNMERIGDEASRVMRLSPSGNSVLIFKADGTFRGAGFEESGVRFDRHDAKVKMIYPAALARIGDTTYAWGDSGIYQCDESGCGLISLPIADELEPVQRSAKAGNTLARGCWAVSNPKAMEVLFSVPNPSSLSTGTVLCVYNQVTDAWVHWLSDQAVIAGVYHGGLLSIQVTGDLTLVERTPETDGEAYTADKAYSVTISAVSGTDVTIDAGSGWDPEVGDLLVRSGETVCVRAVTDSTHFSVTGVVITGVGTAYSAFTSTITPIASTAKNPSLLKTWGEGSVWWGSTYGMLGYDMSFTSSLSPSAVSQTRTLRTTRNTTHVAESFRFVTPRNHSMTTRLYPSVVIRQAGAKWRLEAINVDYRHLGQRVRAK